MVLLGGAGCRDDAILDELLARVAPRSKVQAVVSLTHKIQASKIGPVNKKRRLRNKKAYLAVRLSLMKEELLLQGPAAV